ncbi:uncharacterized protein LOC135165779 [Diachasmimorpha longicaudata]|uniref:uncharacterized protein LOC135165779 n=1 Tax=Diachasmimorpha longicaudata TaxID=58733 RepID=UPI0030B8E971
MYSINKFMVTSTMWTMCQQSANNPRNIDAFVNYVPYRKEWSVQFSNAQYDLQIYQIYQLFSFSGRISNIIQRPNQDRTVYVNYQSEMEARQCVIGMMQRKSIQLRPFSQNHQNSMNNNQSAMNNNQKTMYNTSRPETLGKVSSMKNGNDSEQLNETMISEVQSDESERQNLLEKSDSQTPEEVIKQYKGHNESTVEQFLDTIPFKIEVKSREEEKSVEIQRRSREQRSQVIIEAQEVVVANIPQGYGVFYVLHLLEKLDPICASVVMTLGKDSLRYCHVYFKTPGDAEAAEEAFDDVELAGKKLIVMRPHAMAEEVERYAK